MAVRILGIETSCDDTGVAIYDGALGLVADKLASQARQHAEHGGVVPELAARDHTGALLPLVIEVLEEAGGDPPDALAYTAGPGLAGALLSGASLAAGLAAGWGVPLVPVHHMEGHLLSVLLEHPDVKPPFVALLVSGGHCMLVDVAALGNYQIIGRTLDDAAGEAFDKTARLLGLGYPGGPAIAKVAMNGTPSRFNLPRPMLNRKGLDFSFSGLKTAVRQLAEGLTLDEQTVADVARAFEDTAVDILVARSRDAIKQTGRELLIVAGGVGANQQLRTRLKNEVAAEVLYPRPSLCTDNGAMIAYAGYHRWQLGQTRPADRFEVYPRWELNAIDNPPAQG